MDGENDMNNNNGASQNNAADILLVNVHRDYCGFLNGGLTIGLNLLAVFLRERGYNAEIRMGLACAADELMKPSADGGVPGSIGFYCDYENMTLVRGLSADISSKYGVPVFIGGPQAAELGAGFIEAARCDAVVRGEGEYALLELLDSKLRGGKKIGEIDGISFIDAEKGFVKTPDRPPIEDLDKFPHPDFRLEKGHETWNSFPVMTGRGCPFSCAFCHEGAGVKKVRYRSVESVLAEIKTHLTRHPQCKYLFFIDDTFTLNPKRVAGFCDGLAELRRDFDFVWFCEGHVQTLARDPEMLCRMSEAGLAKLFIGVESGSDRVLSLYRKQTNREMIIKVVSECEKANIAQVAGNIILGGPVESPATIEESLSLVKSLLRAAPGRFDTAGFYFIPYPGTAITLDPEKFGMKTICRRENHSLEDIPLSETESMNFEGLLAARLEFNRAVQKEMRIMYRDGSVPCETILQSYRLMIDYGVYSRWIAQIYPENAVKNNYYTLIAGGALKRSNEINLQELLSWRPQRTFEIWSGVSFDEGYPAAGGRVLSPLEYELLLLCSAKIKLSEVIDSAFEKYGRLFDCRGEFDIKAAAILAEFENNGWMAYSRF